MNRQCNGKCGKRVCGQTHSPVPRGGGEEAPAWSCVPRIRIRNARTAVSTKHRRTGEAPEPCLRTPMRVKTKRRTNYPYDVYKIM